MISLPRSQVAEVDSSGVEIPRWKREMLAKKAAEKGKKEAIAWHQQQLEQKKMAAIPEWKRQLMERKAEEGKK